MKHKIVLNPEPFGIDVAPISRCDLRVGAVSYLNTKPLIFGLQSLAPDLRITIAPPAHLARELRADRLDVALVPVVEYFTRPDYGLIPESAICGDGQIRSVLVFANRPIERAATLCLDPESLTSNTLIKILCRARFRIAPRYVERPEKSDPAALLERGAFDAAVVIGNEALRLSGRAAFEYDMGQEWWRLTRLPFVFAVWAVRPGVETGDLPLVLRRSMELGMTHLEIIAASAARSLDLDEALISTYLRKMLRYELTARAREGMARFRAYCVEMGVFARRTSCNALSP